jgi:hypothetical protein
MDLIGTGLLVLVAAAAALVLLRGLRTILRERKRPDAAIRQLDRAQALHERELHERETAVGPLDARWGGVARRRGDWYLGARRQHPGPRA